MLERSLRETRLGETGEKEKKKMKMSEKFV